MECRWGRWVSRLRQCGGRRDAQASIGSSKTTILRWGIYLRYGKSSSLIPTACVAILGTLVVVEDPRGCGYLVPRSYGGCLAVIGQVRANYGSGNRQIHNGLAKRSD